MSAAAQRLADKAVTPIDDVGEIVGLVDAYVRRGIFRASILPQESRHVISFNLIWFQRQLMTLHIDKHRGHAKLHNVMPALAPRSMVDRQCRAWLRERADETLPAHRRMDPDEVRVGIASRRGEMQLCVTSANGDGVTATRKLIQLANELYLDFLSSAERYDWIVDNFDLDPDAPQWP